MLIFEHNGAAGFAGYKAEKALWDTFNSLCNKVFDAVNEQKNKLHAGLNKADKNRTDFVELILKTADEIKRLEGVRSAESLVYYAKIMIQDLPRGHRKVTIN